MPPYEIRLLEKTEEIQATEKLNDEIWHGGELDIVPGHMITAFIHNGGLAFGAYEKGKMIAFAFGFPGFYESSQGLKIKHCSHQMGVHPDHRGKNIGFALKKAQWQMVRQQGLDLITWTYDPLLSKNAYLNIARLGAVCNTYRRNEYGELKDGLNTGVATDRFQVDWWVNTERVKNHLDKEYRIALGLDWICGSSAAVSSAESRRSLLLRSLFSPCRARVLRPLWRRERCGEMSKSCQLTAELSGLPPVAVEFQTTGLGALARATSVPLI